MSPGSWLRPIRWRAATARRCGGLRWTLFAVIAAGFWGAEAPCEPVASAEELDATSSTDPPSLSLAECIAIALDSQPAIDVEESAMGTAIEGRNIARSFYFPQIGFEARYTHLDDPVSVDINSPITGPIADVFSDAAAFFGIARQAGSAAANFALDNANVPPFSTAKQAALSQLPDTFQVGLLGENSLTTELLLIQPLWTGGKITRRYQQAGLGTEAAFHAVRRSRQQTVFDVTQAYLNVQLADALRQVAEDAAGQFRAIESFVRALVEQGDEYVTTVDLSRVRAVQRLAEADVVRLEHAAILALAALRQAMGLEEPIDFEIADRRMTIPTHTVELPIVLDEAMRNRPELSQARIGVEVAELQRKLAHAQYLPDLALFGRFATVADDGGFPNPNDDQRRQWAVGATLGVPVFTGGRRTAQKHAAEFDEAKAMHTLRLAQQLITLQLTQAWLEYETARRTLPDAQAAAKEAEDTLSGYQDQFRGSLIREEDMPEYIEDLVQSRLLLSEADTRYNQIVHQYRAAIAKIQLVSGSDDYQFAAAIVQPPASMDSDTHAVQRPGRVRLGRLGDGPGAGRQ